MPETRYRDLYELLQELAHLQDAKEAALRRREELADQAEELADQCEVLNATALRALGHRAAGAVILGPGQCHWVAAGGQLVRLRVVSALTVPLAEVVDEAAEEDKAPCLS